MPIIGLPLRRDRPLPPNLGIREGLVAYWPMTEASGVRADVVGGHNLTDVNTVGQEAGKFTTAASFIRANSERLTLGASACGFDYALNDWTWTCWLKPTDWVSYSTLWNKGGTSNAAQGVWITFTAAGVVRVSLSGNNTSANFTGPTVSAGSWHWLAIAWDRDDVFRFMYDGNFSTSVSKADTFNVPIYSNTQTLSIGATYAGTYGYNGLICGMGLWNRKLSDAELTTLYNAGVGKEYPFT